jgi:protein associated with RNAse G/E
MKYTKQFEEFTNEAKKEEYPQEVQDILKNMVDNLSIKKYQLGAFNNYGVWFIELPFTAIHTGNLKKIEKFLPDFSIGIYQGYSGLSIRTNIKVQ